jgi:hypothetical protein
MPECGIRQQDNSIRHYVRKPCRFLYSAETKGAQINPFALDDFLDAH